MVYLRQGKKELKSQILEGGESSMAEGETYGKRPLWQYILIYAAVAAVLYGLIYYFVIAKKDGNSSGTGIVPQQQNTQSAY